MAALPKKTATSPMLPASLLLLAVLLSCSASTAAADASSPPVLKPGPQSTNGVTRYTLDVTVGKRDVDCGRDREVILVNGLFQPTIEVARGDRLEVVVINNIPDTWPDVTAQGGISIHWHGLRQQANPWADGAAWVGQCPIARGSRHLYNFTVDDPEGLYIWHDHAAFNRGDGLQGMLVVRPPGTRVPLAAAEAAASGERLMMLNDWWHYQHGSMGMRLNRPFDPTKATNATGSWCWIGLPSSMLVNGRGVHADCENVYKRKENATMANGAKATAADVMAPTPCVAGQLGPKAAWPACRPAAAPGGANSACGRTEFDAGSAPDPSKGLVFRIVNAATLVYQTVCFQGHSLTLLSADGRAVAPAALGECVDVNAGQRVDVRVAPAAAAGSASGVAKGGGGGAYWISVHGQYRKGAPSAYAVLRYGGGGGGGALPAAPAMQPEEGWGKRWDVAKAMEVKSAKQQADVPQKIDRRFIVHTTQPILQSNGLVRWAANNVAHANTPTCKALAAELFERPKMLSDPSLLANPTTAAKAGGDAGYFPDSSLINSGGRIVVFEEPPGAATKALMDAGAPRAGAHVIHLKLGEAVEIVLQNNRAGAFGGEYNSSSPLTSNRGGREQHPFHMHGGHFFVVGMGLGQWSEANVSSYNLKDPQQRDTATLMFDTEGPGAGWTAVRFKVNNPGVWPFHCHITPHHIMGHAVDLIVEPNKAMAPPKDMPSCPAACTYQFTRWTTPLTEGRYGGNKLMAPPNTNGGGGGARRLLARLRAALGV